MEIDQTLDLEFLEMRGRFKNFMYSRGRVYNEAIVISLNTDVQGLYHLNPSPLSLFLTENNGGHRPRRGHQPSPSLTCWWISPLPQENPR